MVSSSKMVGDATDSLFFLFFFCVFLFRPFRRRNSKMQRTFDFVRRRRCRCRPLHNNFFFVRFFLVRIVDGTKMVENKYYPETMYVKGEKSHAAIEIELNAYWETNINENSKWCSVKLAWNRIATQQIKYLFFCMFHRLAIFFVFGFIYFSFRLVCVDLSAMYRDASAHPVAAFDQSWCAPVRTAKKNIHKIYSNIHTGVRVYRPCVCPSIFTYMYGYAMLNGPMAAATSS